jgi:hypothetical protein
MGNLCHQDCQRYGAIAQSMRSVEVHLLAIQLELVFAHLFAQVAHSTPAISSQAPATQAAPA